MKIRLEHSNVTSSPYHYLYFYLTDKREEGPHIIVSDASEWGDYKGLFVGRYEHYESGESAALYATFQAAMQRVKELTDEYQSQHPATSDDGHTEEGTGGG
jgi:hypothetical protein